MLIRPCRTRQHSCDWIAYLNISDYPEPDKVKGKLHSCVRSLKFIQFNFFSFGQKRTCFLRDFVPRGVFWRLYAKPYWKIIHFLSRQKTAKTFNVPRGNFSIYFWKLLFLANCIIRNLQLSRDHVRYINSFLVMYYLFFTSNNGVNKTIRTYICGTFIWTDSGRHHPECLWNPPFSPKNLTLTC